MTVCDQRGSITVWMLGLVVCVLFLGGLSIDLWRVMNVRRDLAGLADAAAIDGAAAIDEAWYRNGGGVRLDRAAARARAAAALVGRLPADTTSTIAVQADLVRVDLSRAVRLTLLGALLQTSDLQVHVHAHVRPERRL